MARTATAQNENVTEIRTRKTRGPRKEKAQPFFIMRNADKVTGLKIGDMLIPGLTEDQVMGIITNAINSGSLVLIKTITE